MDIIVPEAQGDAGIGFLQSLAKTNLAKEARVICVGKNMWELPMYMFQNSFKKIEGIELPSSDSVSDKGIADVLRLALGSLMLEEGFIAPTAECLTGVFLHPVIQARLKLAGISYEWLPSLRAWQISRSKLMLRDCISDVLETKTEWIGVGDDCFGKPRCGSGSKGCQVVHSRAEAESLDDYVFQPYLRNAPYFVVDIIGGFTVTRKVTKQRDGADTEFTFFRDFELEDRAKKVQEELPGNPTVLNVQFLHDGEKYWIIDIGTRLSGAVGSLLEYDMNILEMLLGDFAGPEVSECPIKRYWSAYPCP